MKRRWFLFEHEVRNGKPFIGAHLVLGETIVPACDASASKPMEVHEPTGFIVSCCACLELSESML